MNVISYKPPCLSLSRAMVKTRLWGCTRMFFNLVLWVSTEAEITTGSGRRGVKAQCWASGRTNNAMPWMASGRGWAGGRGKREAQFAGSKAALDDYGAGLVQSCEGRETSLPSQGGEGTNTHVFAEDRAHYTRKWTNKIAYHAWDVT